MEDSGAVKFEKDTIDHHHALNERLLELQEKVAFKMEPDTTLDSIHEFMASNNLMPLSPIQPLILTGSSHSDCSFPPELADFTQAVSHHVTTRSDGEESAEIRSAVTSSSRKKQRASRTRKRGSSSSSMSSTPSKIRARRPVSAEEIQAQRNQANIRERARTQSLNEAFQNLRQSIPTMPSDKMSKIQTLKLASDYISFLYTVLREGDQSQMQQASSDGSGGDKNLSYCFNMWRMQDVWNSNKDLSNDRRGTNVA